MSRQDKIEEIERLLKENPKVKRIFYNVAELSIEEMKKILTPQDYEEALLHISQEEADRMISQWTDFALRKRPVFNVGIGADEKNLPPSAVPFEERIVTTVAPSRRLSKK